MSEEVVLILTGSIAPTAGGGGGALTLGENAVDLTDLALQVGVPLAATEITQISGGTPPYTADFDVNSDVDPGLSVAVDENNFVSLSGTPQNPSANFSWNVDVFDTSGAVASTQVVSRSPVNRATVSSKVVNRTAQPPARLVSRTAPKPAGSRPGSMSGK